MQPAKQALAAAAWLAAAPLALAHDGHGLAGSHWHASEAGGLALVALLASIAIWLSRRD